MPGPHPKELRARVVAAWEAGEGSFKELAGRFKVGEASVNRWVALKRRTGGLDALPMGGARRAHVVDSAGEQMLRDVLDCVPDCTLGELCDLYMESRGVPVSKQTMSDTVRRLGYSRKRGSTVGGPPPRRRQ